MIFVVAYDLTSPNDTPQNYERIMSAIKSLYPTWCHIEKSVWLINSPLDAGAIRESLKQYISANQDVLFVARLEGNWSSWNFGEQRNNWMHQQTF